MIDGACGPRIRWLFTDRFGGSSRRPYDEMNLATHVGDTESAVLANRNAAARRLVSTSSNAEGFDLATPVAPRVVAIRAVHGSSIAVADDSTLNEVGDVDGLVSRTPGIALLAMAADCVPMVMADPVGVIAVVHAGWRGLASGVALAAIDSMVDAGAQVESIECILGPAICGRCYPVDQARYDEVVGREPSAASMSATGQVSLDIRTGVAAQLARRGVSVTQVGPCTFESHDYFSYRRDAVTGRHGALITLTSDQGSSS